MDALQLGHRLLACSFCVPALAADVHTKSRRSCKCVADSGAASKAHPTHP